MKAFLFACSFTKKQERFTNCLGLLSIKIAKDRKHFDKWFLESYLQKHVKKFDTWDLNLVVGYKTKENALKRFTQITKSKAQCKKYKLGLQRSY